MEVDEEEGNSELRCQDSGLSFEESSYLQLPSPQQLIATDSFIP